jgi:hypothetical protein
MIQGEQRGVCTGREPEGERRRVVLKSRLAVRSVYDSGQNFALIEW